MSETQLELPLNDQNENYKLSISDTVAKLKQYLENANKSLAQLQENINGANNQIQEWRKLELMIVGQKQVVADLLVKITGDESITGSGSKTSK